MTSIIPGHVHLFFCQVGPVQKDHNLQPFAPRFCCHAVNGGTGAMWTCSCLSKSKRCMQHFPIHDIAEPWQQIGAICLATCPVIWTGRMYHVHVTTNSGARILFPISSLVCLLRDVICPDNKLLLLLQHNACHPHPCACARCWHDEKTTWCSVLQNGVFFCIPKINRFLS